MLVLSVLGMALLYFVRGGAAGTQEYLRETQLETAAKAAVAELGGLVVADDPQITGLAENERKKLATLNYDGTRAGASYPMTVTVTALRRGDYIYLVACAIESEPEVRYERRKIVKGVWLRDGNDKYVYQGWAP